MTDSGGTQVDGTTALLMRIRTEMKDYVMPQAARSQLENDLAEAERLLIESAAAADDKIRDFQAQWTKITQTGWVEHTVLRTTEVSGNDMRRIAFSPDGTLLAAATTGNNLALWDVSSGEQFAFLKNHIEFVLLMTFSPDGNTLAYSDHDYVYLWDVAEKRQRARITLDGPFARRIVFSPDGTVFTFTRGFTYTENPTVSLWRTTDGQPIAKLQGHTAPAKCSAFSPDGALLATSSLKENIVRIWNVASKRQQTVLRGDAQPAQCITFSPDGTVLAVATEDGIIQLWNIGTGRIKTVLRGHNGCIENIAFNLDGTKLASSSNADVSIRLWDVVSGRELLVHKANDKNDLVGFALSPNGSMLAGWINGIYNPAREIKLWSTITGKQTGALQLAYGAVEDVTFSPDGLMLACAHGSNVTLWGRIMPKVEWERLERERLERERLERERREKERLEREQLAERWRASGIRLPG